MENITIELKTWKARNLHVATVFNDRKELATSSLSNCIKDCQEYGYKIENADELLKLLCAMGLFD